MDNLLNNQLTLARVRRAVVKERDSSGLKKNYWTDHEREDIKDDIKVDGNTVDIGRTRAIYFHRREHMRAGRSLGFTQCIRSCVVCRSVSRILFQRFAWDVPAFRNRPISNMHEARKDVGIVLKLY